MSCQSRAGRDCNVTIACMRVPRNLAVHWSSSPGQLPEEPLSAECALRPSLPQSARRSSEHWRCSGLVHPSSPHLCAPGVCKAWNARCFFSVHITMHDVAEALINPSTAGSLRADRPNPIPVFLGRNDTDLGEMMIVSRC